MDCDSVIDRIDEYVDGHLPPEEDEAFTRHIERCERCQREAAIWKALLAGLRAEHKRQSSPEEASKRVRERTDPIIKRWIEHPEERPSSPEEIREIVLSTSTRVLDHRMDWLDENLHRRHLKAHLMQLSTLKYLRDKARDEKSRKAVEKRIRELAAHRAKHLESLHDLERGRETA